ncbi:hypothetical protein LTR56_010058 [Elasticomyces elasticus]|nr:hypothetical protein LTR56_010058 [Elasticomyces elasticus]KAK3664999.1 hypothetical protein LTR22_004051 [Elasticomyces elasticus]KAK4931625.1 hypothetical protein LTR49_002017 [Elasticomyces elasticus]KAK5766784.1 hypothetical protein LTS12_003137 [Elasticomyces elasticus]
MPIYIADQSGNPEFRTFGFTLPDRDVGARQPDRRPHQSDRRTRLTDSGAPRDTSYASEAAAEASFEGRIEAKEAKAERAIESHEAAFERAVAKMPSSSSSVSKPKGGSKPQVVIIYMPAGDVIIR